jgi:hypothetical protein
VNVRKVVPDALGGIEMMSYQTAEIEGLSVFYREAGNPANPTLVLLHGYPSSSFMFCTLIPALEVTSLRRTTQGSATASRPRPRSSSTPSTTSRELSKVCWSRSA